MPRELKDVSMKSYLSTAPFNSYFFTYTTSSPPPTYNRVGVLSANVAGATSITCPAGRVLRENGRRLYPSAHPGVTTLMVGVFDNQSMLSGFIDPNSPVFAIYSTDRPGYLKDAVDPTGGLTDQGSPVKTNGVISSNIVSLGVLTGAGATLDLATGRVFKFTLPAIAVSTVVYVSPSPPLPGVLINLIITGGTGSLGFSSSFKTSGFISISGTNTITMTFVSDGTYLWETSRTGNLF